MEENTELELQKAKTINELIENCPKNLTVLNNLIRAWSIIKKPTYERIICSLSGGSDSDVMLDIVWRCDTDDKVDYVWFDTGLEYQATKDHLKYLEDKYKIAIKPYKAIKPIPASCKQFGQPFISKYVSEFISRLQRHNFQWEDDSFENLIIKYPKCKSALNWWCNNNGEKSSFNINRNKWLKEFIINNPPTFKISNKCCTYAKKKISHNLINNYKYDLNIIGVRKSEGGARATAYKSCFDNNYGECDNYRPLFWYKDEDKKDYEKAYGILHSKCYTNYGLKRTGCVGCPFGRDFEFELSIVKQYEPKLYRAVTNIFRDSYEYTKQYREFCRKMKTKEN